MLRIFRPLESQRAEFRQLWPTRPALTARRGFLAELAARQQKSSKLFRSQSPDLVRFASQLGAKSRPGKPGRLSTRSPQSFVPSSPALTARGPAQGPSPELPAFAARPSDGPRLTLKPGPAKADLRPRRFGTPGSVPAFGRSEPHRAGPPSLRSAHSALTPRFNFTALPLVRAGLPARPEPLITLSTFYDALIPGRCTFCEGSTLCQSCFPPGSKKNYAGEDCAQCRATGRCPYCKGGRCHLCDGRGFQTGCNNRPKLQRPHHTPHHTSSHAKTRHHTLPAPSYALSGNFPAQSRTPLHGLR